MKVLNTIKIYFAILALTMFISCKKEDVLNSGQNDVITVKEGTLKFPSKEKFDETINHLRQNSKEAEQWESTFIGFKSNKQAYDAIPQGDWEGMKKESRIYEQYKNLITLVEKNGDIEAQEVISGALSRVVNDRNEVIIGKDKYLFSYKDLVITKNSDNVSQSKTETIPAKRVNAEAIYRNQARMLGSKDHYYEHDGNSKKLCMDLDYTVYGNYYTDLSACNRHYKRFALIWWLNQTGSLSVSVSGSGGVGPTSNSNNCSACSTVYTSLPTTYNTAYGPNGSYQLPIYGYYLNKSSSHTSTIDNGEEIKRTQTY